MGFPIKFLARPEEAPLSKSYNSYVVERERPITQSKNFIWKAYSGSIAFYDVIKGI